MCSHVRSDCEVIGHQHHQQPVAEQRKRDSNHRQSSPAIYRLFLAAVDCLWVFVFNKCLVVVSCFIYLVQSYRPSRYLKDGSNLFGTKHDQFLYFMITQIVRFTLARW